MSTRRTAIAVMLPLLLLAACGSREPAPAGNDAASAEGIAAQGAAPGNDAPGNSAAADPAQPGAPADGTAEPVPPPDAVSHPNGYLPPAPAEPGSPSSNSTGPDSSGRATEDQYIRNGL